MKEIVQRLVADMRWRLSSAGKKYKPKRREKEIWGGLRLPGVVPFLIILAYAIFCWNGASGLAHYFPAWLDWLPSILFGWAGWLLIVPTLLLLLHNKLQRDFDLAAYRSLLSKSERATLIEYVKYLRRQIRRAREEPSLGGLAEVKRLEQLAERLNDLLKQGIGKDLLPAVESKLSEEAGMAEAVIEAYDITVQDPLSDLDARLPDEIRQRVEELDREAVPLQRPRETA